MGAPPPLPSRLSQHEGLLEPVAGSAELHEPAMVHHAVDDGRLELVVGEDRALPADLDAGGEYHAPSLVAVRYDLVQESRSVHVEGHVAELVQDQEHRLARGHLARRRGGEMLGESVFDGSQEIIYLPNTLAARVMLRNSRIRQV